MTATVSISEAIAHLRAARDLLKRADAPQATDAVRRAMKSAEGALRHSQGRDCRKLMGRE